MRVAWHGGRPGYANYSRNSGEFLIRCARPKGTPKGPKKKKKKKIKIDNGHIKTPKFLMLYCSFGYFLRGTLCTNKYR